MQARLGGIEDDDHRADVLRQHAHGLVEQERAWRGRLHAEFVVTAARVIDRRGRLAESGSGTHDSFHVHERARAPGAELAAVTALLDAAKGKFG